MSEITTGYEIYDDEELDVNASIQNIQDSMLERDPEKYGNFLETLGKIETALKYMMIPNRKTRVDLFKYVYFAMRLIDDVVDGDTNPPLSLDTRKKLMESILSGNINDIKNPLYKELARRINELSAQLNQDDSMRESLQYIIVSMNYDLSRIMDNNKTRQRDDLHENFHKMDIVGTIVGSAIIFGIDPKNAVQLLSPLGEASRVMYNLRDFGEDIVANLINIPQEELDFFGISDTDIKQVKSAGKDIEFQLLPQSIKHWFQAEIKKIQKLMEAYRENMRQDCEFIDNPNWLMNKVRNLVMKRKVFPKTYTDEIESRIPQILSQVS